MSTRLTKKEKYDKLYIVNLVDDLGMEAKLMFKVGELIVHSEHGVCEIDNIIDKTYGGKTRTYYELHPIDNNSLKISIPVNNDKVMMLEVMEKEEAIKIIESFKEPGVEWINDVKVRNKEYNKIIQSADRMNISKIVNTLIRKKLEASTNKKSFAEQDKKLLSKTKHILFEELALALDKSYGEIERKVKSLMNIAG